jgi:nicotinamidase-related amidase
VPFDLDAVLEPARTAVVTVEMQRGVIGDLGFSPQLSAVAAERHLVEHAARLVAAARDAGVRVVHAVVEMRADRAGTALNNRMLAAAAKNADQVREASAQAELVPELAGVASDLVSRRSHGLTPFTGTELDATLRNLGVTTVVLTGISVNIAVLGAALSASDLGYDVVVPRDAVVSLPAEYADTVFEHTLGFVATVTTVDAVLAAWEE